MSLPSNVPQGDEIRSPKLGLSGWVRWIWAQVTSMRTALLLLLLLSSGPPAWPSVRFQLL